MKVITAIYLHVRPDLRDEWLAGVDVDTDVEESLVCLFPSRFSVFFAEPFSFLAHFVASRASPSSPRSILQYETLFYLRSFSPPPLLFFWRTRITFPPRPARWFRSFVPGRTPSRPERVPTFFSTRKREWARRRSGCLPSNSIS